MLTARPDILGTFGGVTGTHRLAQDSGGRLSAAEKSPDGLLRAAATPRLMQAYAAGR